MKICSKCKINKENTDFYADRRQKTGLQSNCKACFKRQHDTFHKTSKFKEWTRGYNKKNRKELNEKHYRWQKTEYGKKYLSNYVKTEKHKIYKRKYEKEYRKREIVKEKDRLGLLKYRTNKISTSDNTVTFEATQKMLLDQGNKCKICGICFTKLKKNLDHIIPISKGGRHTITNVQWLCYVCNVRKSNKIYENNAPSDSKSNIQT